LRPPEFGAIYGMGFKVKIISVFLDLSQGPPMIFTHVIIEDPRTYLLETDRAYHGDDLFSDV